MKGKGQQDIHVPFPVWSTRCEPPLPPEGNSRNAFPRGRQVQLCQNPAALAPWVSHWLRMAGLCTLAWFGFSSLAGVIGKQHSHLSRAKIFLRSQKEKKRKNICHLNLSAGPSVHGGVERAAEGGFVLNTGGMLALLKRGQSHEHGSVSEPRELPWRGERSQCAGPAPVASRILQQGGFSGQEARD